MKTAYLMTGVGEIYSDGLYTLAERLESMGFRALVYSWYQWQAIVTHVLYTNPEKIVLVGHSKGGNNTGTVAEELKRYNRIVDLVVALDPVRGDNIPDNVREALCFRQNKLPFIGTKLHLTYGNTITNVSDYELPHLNHFNIDKNEDVHNRIMKAVEQI